MSWKEKYKKLLIGLGLDADGVHKWITKGENFYLFGGSKLTHRKMQEIAIKFNEHLKKRHKTLDTISEKEFVDIAHKVGIQRFEGIEKYKKRFEA